MVGVLGVTLPVRRVMCRFAKGKIVPCEWGDNRGTLVVTFEQTGRSVIPVRGDRGELGYRFSDVDNHDVVIFAAWIKTHPKISRQERSA